MSTILHRSENLSIMRTEELCEIRIEIRFTNSSTDGFVQVACPKCGHPGMIKHWEVEGPDGSQNTVWLNCHNERCSGDDFTWSKTVTFSAWRER